MHYPAVTRNYHWLPHNANASIPTPDEYKDMVVQPLGDKQSFYEDLIQGCFEFYGKKGKRCQRTEDTRIQMNLRQPKGMYNYTKLGYTKIRAPEHVFKLIKEFWEKNKGKEKPEVWPAGNTFTNHWVSWCCRGKRREGKNKKESD
jgi:prolyl 4-hydroxylase